MLSVEKAEINKKRIDWIDGAKGLGILLVVLGHTYGIPHWLYCLIYGFHMPLFFLLSGLTYRCDSSIRAAIFIKKLIKKYLLPYFLLAGINLLLQCMWLWYLDQLSIQVCLKYICGILYCYANVTWMPNCSPIWFLPGIFFAKLFLFVVYRLFGGNKRKITIGILVLGAIALIADYLNAPRLPWNVIPAMMGVVFLWVGVCLRQNACFMEKNFNRASVFSVAIALLLTPMIIDNAPGMNENFYDNGPLFLISGFGYSFIAIFLVIKAGKITRIFSYFGTGTMVFMGFNYCARTIATELYYLLPFGKSYPLSPAISFFMTVGVLTAILEIYKRGKVLVYRRGCNAT